MRRIVKFPPMANFEVEPTNIMGDWYYSAKMGDSGPFIVGLWFFTKKTQIFEINDDLDICFLLNVLACLFKVMLTKIELTYLCRGRWGDCSPGEFAEGRICIVIPSSQCGAVSAIPPMSLINTTMNAVSESKSLVHQSLKFQTLRH